MSEDFEVIIRSVASDGTEILTSPSDMSDEWLAKAVASYNARNNIYSAYLKDGNSSSEKLTPEYIDQLAKNAQTDLNKIQIINSIARKEINEDGIIGKTYECITTNINTKSKISYCVNDKDETILDELNQVKTFVNKFNKQINLKRLIRNSIPTAYAEGNYICYLRHDNNKYKIDYYPLGVCEIADYEIDGEPVVLLNVRELRNRLQKVYKKTKKNKALFFSKIEEEIKASYPIEVYEAFKAKEDYAILNPKYTGVIRINNLNRKYGLTPIFRTFKDLLMLDTFDNADRVNSKAKAKKIIHQKLRKETMGVDYNKRGFEEMSYAHENFMQAFKMPTVVVTTPPQVEEIKYIEPTIELTDVKTVNNYRSRILASLGISFLMDSGSQSVSTASISVTQLMRTIGMISEQLEEILQKWYETVLEDNGYSLEYCPTIEIIDSELLEMEIKKDLATTLYSTLNCSLETALELLDIDVKDELIRRKHENNEGYENIFFPRASTYTTSNDSMNTNNINDGNSNQNNKNNSNGGRPLSSKNKTQQQYDKARNKLLK